MRIAIAYMKHKAAKLILISLATVASLASAAGNDSDVMTSMTDRLPISARDLMPELNQLNCTPRWDGQTPVCGEHKTLDGCLQQSSSNGCFWTCD